jgi:glycosyltransferase involved in cell wall biosynthesis
MRVAHVITRLIVGGAQENTIATVLGLRRRGGWEVDLISGPSRGPEGSLESVLGGDVGALTLLPELVRPVHPWKDWLAWRRLTKLFRDWRPDIVHTHSGKAGVLGRLAAARASVPVIVHTIHGPSFGAFQSGPANRLFHFAEGCAARVTTHFVVVAQAMRDQYLAAGIGRSEQYTRILSGFDLDPFLRARNDLQLRAELGLEPQDIVVGKIARLSTLKGHDDLFAIAPEIVASCPRIKFLLVGDGQWRGRFESLAKQSGLQRHFVFAGLVPPQAVPGLVGVMDMVVHLSAREGLARALPQALAAAKPVIAYDCDGASEVCLENETGYLLPRGDLPALREGLLRLARDAGLRDRLGCRGREFVRQRFGVELMVGEIEKLYRQLTARAAPAGAKGEKGV